MKTSQAVSDRTNDGGAPLQSLCVRASPMRKSLPREGLYLSHSLFPRRPQYQSLRNEWAKYDDTRTEWAKYCYTHDLGRGGRLHRLVLFRVRVGNYHATP